MYGLLLFLHIGSVAIWVGSIIMVVILLSMLKKDLQSPKVAELTGKTIKVFNRVTHPSSFLVLLTGVFMLMSDTWGMANHDSFPFWITFMEQAGSVVILVFIIAISIIGKKATKRLAAGDHAAALKSINTLVITALVLAIAALAVIYVVSGKF
jgi:putative copper export protein